MKLPALPCSHRADIPETQTSQVLLRMFFATKHEMKAQKLKLLQVKQGSRGGAGPHSEHTHSIPTHGQHQLFWPLPAVATNNKNSLGALKQSRKCKACHRAKLQTPLANPSCTQTPEASLSLRAWCKVSHLGARLHPPSGHASPVLHTTRPRHNALRAQANGADPLCSSHPAESLTALLARNFPDPCEAQARDPACSRSSCVLNSCSIAHQRHSEPGS